jgi:hypothetical protein
LISMDFLFYHSAGTSIAPCGEIAALRDSSKYPCNPSIYLAINNVLL